MSVRESRESWLRPGATVIGTARTQSDFEGTIADIENAGGKGLALVADAMSRPDGERVVNTAMDRFGRIDILVNNVGGSTYARFLDITDEDFRHTFDWCVTSAFIMSQLVAPHMLSAGHGSIVNIALGSFATECLQGSLDLMPGSLEKMNEATPLHRLGNLEDLGRLTVYVSTRDCYATNAIFHVDGGIDSNNSSLPITDY